jgi:hypothetical protein
MRKTRSDNILANLPGPQREKLNAWLLTRSYRKVQELIAQPPPEGFGLRVHITSIGNYYKSAMPLYLESIRDDRAIAAAQLSVGEAGKEDLNAATLDALRCRLFRLSLNDSSDSNELGRMFRLMEKLKSDAKPVAPPALARGMSQSDSSASSNPPCENSGNSLSYNR